MLNKSLKVTLLLTVIFLLTSCNAANLRGNEQNTIPIPLTPQAPSDNLQEKEGSIRFVVMADCRGSNGGINVEAINQTFENIKKLTPLISFSQASETMNPQQGQAVHVLLLKCFRNFKPIS
ncbi:MAG: hypothetical protein GX434_00770 [Peptococcaceae bacterium]|nr:hypothetical protein [Peptococcaceae bacterium]